MYDIIIIGGGPAGLTAALYARRANKTVLVIEKGSFGGQITYSPKVENIPGFTEITGNEFADKMIEQVLAQEAEIECAEVLSVKNDENCKTVITDSGDFTAKAVIIATGAKHRLLGLEKEETFIGEGISFCAVCDGAFYENKAVAVIGGGNSALQEALLLSDLANQVYIIQNLNVLTGEKKLIEQVSAKENISVITESVVEELLGESSLTGVCYKNVVSGDITKLPLDGMFIAIGLIPQNDIFKDVLNINDYGYIVADERCTTSADGFFVAGDCRTKTIRQVTTAVGDGAVAAIAACEYIDSLN